PHGHALQNSIAERSMKHVAGASGVHAIHHKGRRVEELAALERERSMRAECHGGNTQLVLALDGLERFEWIALAGPLGRELGAGDEVVDVRQHAIEAVI